jgi:hypothetical protein
MTEVERLREELERARALLARCLEDGVGIHQTIVKVRAFLRDPRREESEEILEDKCHKELGNVRPGKSARDEARDAKKERGDG